MASSFDLRSALQGLARAQDTYQQSGHRWTGRHMMRSVDIGSRLGKKQFEATHMWGDAAGPISRIFSEARATDRKEFRSLRNAAMQVDPESEVSSALRQLIFVDEAEGRDLAEDDVRSFLGTWCAFHSQGIDSTAGIDSRAVKDKFRKEARVQRASNFAAAFLANHASENFDVNLATIVRGAFALPTT